MRAAVRVVVARPAAGGAGTGTHNSGAVFATACCPLSFKASFLVGSLWLLMVFCHWNLGVAHQQPSTPNAPHMQRPLWSLASRSRELAPCVPAVRRAAVPLLPSRPPASRRNRSRVPHVCL